MISLYRRTALLLPVALLLLWPQTGQASVIALVNEGAALVARGEYAAGLELLHEAEGRLPDRSTVAGLLGHAYIGLGYQSLQARQPEAALDAFLAAEAYRPDDVQLWQGEAIAALHLGRNAQAEVAVQRALGLATEAPHLYALLGRIRYAAGDMAGALSALEQARDLGGDEKVLALLAKVEREWQHEQGMQRDYGSVFHLSYADDGRSDLTDAILATLEKAYAELGAELDYYPDIEVPVLLYTRQAFRQVTNSPDWAGALYDGKIRIPLGGLQRMTPELKALLYHEYAHALLRFLGRGRLPHWLNEGYAELAGRRHHDPGLEQLQQARAAQRLLSWERLADGFEQLPAEQVRLAYQQSYALVAFLIDRFGWHLFRDLVEALADGATLAGAFHVAYGDYGMDWERLQESWREGL
ncbi:MAG: peptidase MA family metallohydrolase [Desulfuromonadales bacterium]|nr:peptidase MA family metallohydrolase [Desulfuromonadales bacterium]